MQTKRCGIIFHFINVVIGTVLQDHIEFSVGTCGAVIVIISADVYHAGEFSVLCQQRKIGAADFLESVRNKGCDWLCDIRIVKGICTEYGQGTFVSIDKGIIEAQQIVTRLIGNLLFVVRAVDWIILCYDFHIEQGCELL